MNPNSSCKADLDQRSRALATSSKRAVDTTTATDTTREIYWPAVIRMPLQRLRGVTAVQNRGDAFYIELLCLGRAWVGSQANS